MQYGAAHEGAMHEGAHGEHAAASMGHNEHAGH